MVLPSREACRINTSATGGWTWVESEARKCGHVGCYHSDMNTSDFVHLFLPLEKMLPSLVCVLLQVGIVDKLHLQYPHSSAGYYVKFADGDRQAYVHANLRLAPTLIGRAVNTCS